MKTLHEIQTEIGDWASAQFGDNPDMSHPDRGSLDEIPPFYGMLTELAELGDIDVREMQGRSKIPTHELRQEARKDALGDLLIFACDYASRMGIDLTEALNKTWAKVAQRRRDSWEKDKGMEDDIILRMKKEIRGGGI